MRHKVALKKLNKTPAHRKAMLRNMLIALFREKRIKTTVAKAKVLRKFAEKFITRGKKDSVHNRRMVAKWIHDKAVLNSLFTEISPLYLERNGGYTRVVKIGPRAGDGAEMAFIMLIEDEATVDAKPSKKKKKQEDKKQQSTEKKLKNNHVSTKSKLETVSTDNDEVQTDQSTDDVSEKIENEKNDETAKDINV